MRALLQPDHDGPETMRLVDREEPAAGAGEYVVRVEAAGINFADVMQTRGTYGGGPPAPYVAGFEAAGVIVAADATIAEPLPIGARVVGTGPGAFAEHMVMPAGEVMPVPTGWSAAQSLGMVLNWATALAALRPLGQVAPGDVVVVHAAAGGVGQAAVRMARHYGATVVATASPGKHDLVRDLGAAAVVDSRAPDLAERLLEPAGPADVVLESVGRTTLHASLAATKPIVGRVVIFGAASGPASLTTDDLVFAHPVQVKGLHIGRLAATAPAVYEDLVTELHRLIEAGVYPPGRPQVHALAQGPGVLSAMESGTTHGKHAIDPRS